MAAGLDDPGSLGFLPRVALPELAPGLELVGCFRERPFPSVVPVGRPRGERSCWTSDPCIPRKPRRPRAWLNRSGRTRDAIEDLSSKRSPAPPSKQGFASLLRRGVRPPAASAHSESCSPVDPPRFSRLLPNDCAWPLGVQSLPQMRIARKTAHSRRMMPCLACAFMTFCNSPLYAIRPAGRHRRKWGMGSPCFSLYNTILVKSPTKPSTTRPCFAWISLTALRVGAS